jgi:catecholate siderophore receptor
LIKKGHYREIIDVRFIPRALLRRIHRNRTSDGRRNRGGFFRRGSGARHDHCQRPAGTGRHAQGGRALLDTPRSIVVVDKQVIKETGSATLVEALRTVPGITFGAAEGGNPIGDRPFIRGFDSQGSTYLDGVRDIGAQNREVFAVEQIQVVRGSDSTLGGRGSAGGSLNIVSKTPRNENFVGGSVTVGTDNYKRITGDVNYVIGSNVALRINGMWHDQDVAGRDAIFQKRWGVAPSLTIGVDGPTKLTLSYYHLDTDELPDSGIPFLYSIANAPLGLTYNEPALGKITTISGVTGFVDRDTFYGLKSRDFRESKNDQLTLRFDHDFGNGIKFRNTSRFNHSSQAYSFLLPDDSTGNVFGTATTNPTTGAAGTRGDILTGGLIWRRANTRFGYSDSMTNQTDLYGKFKTGAIEHSFALGTEFSLEKTERGAFVLATGSTVTPRCNTLTISRYYCTSIFNPNPNDPWVNYASDAAGAAETPITRGAPGTRTINNATTKALYAFDSISIGESLIVNLGARYDSFKTRVTLPLIGGVRPEVERKDDIFNWQAVSSSSRPATPASMHLTPPPRPLRTACWAKVRNRTAWVPSRQPLRRRWCRRQPMRCALNAPSRWKSAPRPICSIQNCH